MVEYLDRIPRPQACRGSEEAALRVYDALLGARSDAANGELLRSPVLRLRLLRSVVPMLTALARRLGAHQPATALQTLRGSARREVLVTLFWVICFPFRDYRLWVNQSAAQMLPWHGIRGQLSVLSVHEIQA